MRFIYRKKGRRGCYHIGNRSKTMCKLENGTHKLQSPTKYIETDEPPSNRTLCVMCNNVYTKRLRQFRNDYIVNHNPECMVCGAKESDGIELYADYIKDVSMYPHLAKDINNLKVCCQHHQ